MKICIACKELKVDTDFDYYMNWRTHTKSTRRNVCNLCYSQQHIEWRKKHIVKWCEWLEEEGVFIRCSQCGVGSIETFAMLDFHHVIPKEDSKSSIGAKIQKLKVKSERAWDTLKEIKEQCVILCANCHRLLHAGSIFLPT